MPRRAPRVSIGMPVYNGEPSLKEAIDSLLAQTFADFELIIADNASTDATEAICREYVAQDKRIRYLRNDRNLGAARNFNLVFHLSSARYFKWAAHDDMCGGEYLSQCVRVLDHDVSAVLCQTKAKGIDEEGRFLHDYHFNLNVSAPSAAARFRDLLLMEHWCIEVFGVMRSEVLRKTPLIASYSASDNVLLAELALYGPFGEVPETLFFHRQRSPERVYPTLRSREGWFDPSREGRVAFPWWLHLGGYSSAILRAPLGLGERVRCSKVLAEWVMKNRHGLVDDLEAGFPPFKQVYPAAKYPLKGLIRGTAGLYSLLNRKGKPTKDRTII